MRETTRFLAHANRRARLDAAEHAHAGAVARLNGGPSPRSLGAAASGLSVEAYDAMLMCLALAPKLEARAKPVSVQKTSRAAACACSTTATASCSSALSPRGTVVAAQAASRWRSSRGMAPSSRRALCAVSARAAGGPRRRPREPSRARAASLWQARRRPPAVWATRRRHPSLARKNTAPLTLHRSSGLNP